MEVVSSLFPAEGRNSVEEITFAQLKDQVALYASALRRLGVQKDDRVVGE